MENPRILVFGDSWAHGDELNPGEQVFGNIIASKLNGYCNNFSVSSTSIPHLILQFRHFLNTRNFKLENCYPIFFLSSPYRDLVFENTYPKELNPTRPENSYWYKHYASHELAEYRTNTSILALQQMCKVYNLTSFFVWGWDKVDLWEEIETENFYPVSCAEMFTDNYTTIINLNNSKNKFIWPNGGHPNQLGHQKIADNLTKFIQEKLTALSM